MSQAFQLINHTKYWKTGDMPMPAMVTLALGAHGSDGEDTHYLTQQLASDAEIDAAFDRLQTHLERDRKAAKLVIKRENKKIKAGIKIF